jgi:hypothetical protein
VALPACKAVFQSLSIEVPAHKRLSPREKANLHNPDDGTRLGKPLEASYGERNVNRTSHLRKNPAMRDRTAERRKKPGRLLAAWTIWTPPFCATWSATGEQPIMR